MVNEIIDYKHYNWGPLLYSAKVAPEVVTKILEICDESTRSKVGELAGHIEKELRLPPLEVFSHLKPYFRSYAKASGETPYFRPLPLLTMESAWVNYMEAGDFNPPHNHDGVLSFVIFLKVTDELEQENLAYKGRSVGPGGIVFRNSLLKRPGSLSTDDQSFFPEEGTIFIFPAHLEHWVFPFKSKGTRVSLSGNLGELIKSVVIK